MSRAVRHHRRGHRGDPRGPDAHRRRRRGPRERGRPRHGGREGHARGGQLHGHATAAGCICLPLTGEQLDALRHPADDADTTPRRRARRSTSRIGAKGRITTGISAADRADDDRGRHRPATRGPRTSRCPGTCSRCARSPGGVLERAGHTEAVGRPRAPRRARARRRHLRDHERGRHDGAAAAARGGRRASTASRWSPSRTSSATAGAPSGSSSASRPCACRRASATSPRTATRSLVDGSTHVALVAGDVAGEPDVLVRVHSECLTGDVFHSLRCDCGAQLEEAMRRVQAEGRGRRSSTSSATRAAASGWRTSCKAYELQEQGAGHGRGERGARLPRRPARLRHRRADPRRPRRHLDAPA